MMWLLRLSDNWTEKLQDAYAQLREATIDIQEASELLEEYDNGGSAERTRPLERAWKDCQKSREALRWADQRVGRYAPVIFKKERAMLSDRIHRVEQEIMSRKH